jgi:hypothetical protein
MNIMGIQTVVVYQRRNEVKYRRCADPINLVSQVMRGPVYAGFQIDSFGTINFGGYIGSVMLYSYNAYHYDAIVVNHEGVDKLGMFQSVDNPVSELVVFQDPSNAGGSSSSASGRGAKETKEEKGSKESIFVCIEKSAESVASVASVSSVALESSTVSEQQDTSMDELIARIMPESDEF